MLIMHDMIRNDAKEERREDKMNEILHGCKFGWDGVLKLSPKFKQIPKPERPSPHRLVSGPKLPHNVRIMTKNFSN